MASDAGYQRGMGYYRLRGEFVVGTQGGKPVVRRRNVWVKKVSAHAYALVNAECDEPEIREIFIVDGDTATLIPAKVSLRYGTLSLDRRP